MHHKKISDMVKLKKKFVKIWFLCPVFASLRFVICFRSLTIYSSAKSHSFLTKEQFKFLINLCTLFTLFFAIVICFTVMIYLGLKYFWTLTSNPAPTKLTCNACLAIICSCCSLIPMTLSTISNDLNISIFKRISLWKCSFRDYLHVVVCLTPFIFPMYYKRAIDYFMLFFVNTVAFDRFIFF